MRSSRKIGVSMLCLALLRNPYMVAANNLCIRGLFIHGLYQKCTFEMICNIRVRVIKKYIVIKKLRRHKNHLKLVFCRRSKQYRIRRNMNMVSQGRVVNQMVIRNTSSILSTFPELFPTYPDNFLKIHNYV